MFRSPLREHHSATSGAVGNRGNRPTRSQLRATTRGGLLISALAAALLVYQGSRQFIGFDSYWHLFIAQQPTWRAFWREVFENAHPPLVYLTLKILVRALGKSLLVYRLVSIVPVFIATIFFARLAARATSNTALALIATAAFGLSANVIEVGLEVRSYGLLLAFLLVAASAQLEWLAARPGSASLRTRATFALALSLALASHYSAFFFLCAALATPLVLCALHRRWRALLRAEFRRHKTALAAMFGVPLLTGAVVYAAQMRLYAHRISHVSEFLYDAGTESRLRFLFRTSKDLLLLFLPSSSGALLVRLAVLVALGSLALVARRASRGRLAVVPFVLLGLMLALNLVAGLSARYPFGGEMRHEFFLFPFAVLCLFIGVDQLRRALPAKLARAPAWSAAIGLLVVGSLLHGLLVYPFATENPVWESQLARFRGVEPAPSAILLDQFSTIRLFGHLHDWTWRLVSEQPEVWATGQYVWQIWSVSRGEQQFTVCRTREWELDFSKPLAYSEVAACLQHSRDDRVAVFRPETDGMPPPWSTVETPALAHALEEGSHVHLETLLVDGTDLYATFRGAHATPPALLALDEALYGGNCAARFEVLTQRLRPLCDGHDSCIVRLDPKELGDPALGCRKDFAMTWRCGGESADRHLFVPGEAGDGAVVSISCPR